MDKKHIAMLIGVILIMILPLALYQGKGEEQGYFAGADSAASEELEKSGYEPWFEPIWEPPSGEIESLLFATQAAIGAIIIGYFIGYYKGKQES